MHRVTHGHPSGYLSAGALVTIIALIAEGQPLSVAVTTSLEIRPLGTGQERSAVPLALLRSAVRLAGEIVFQRVGEAGSERKPWPSAAPCSLAAPTPEEAIVAAVNHAWDLDSTGAITGNIVGAMHGPAAQPLA